MEEKKTYYISTPIYYPSGNLHVGHTFCTVAADTLARYKRLEGYDVMFLTGTDEHGQKIERVATENGMTPKEYVDKIVEGILNLWDVMEISNDDFIRTTEPRHTKVIQKIFTKLYEQGDIYKGKYKGWYCSPCESFWLERQLVDGKCPDCGRPVEMAEEESYFFKLSKYADRLIKHIEDNPGFIEPESRKNEMLNNFLLPGLEDLAVSRTSFKWGIPVPFDPDHVVYVWIDALSNYITALGYMSEDDSKFKKYWPADVHLVGKEIVRFHTIIWPIMLLALDLPLPKKVFGHGWVIFGGDKMSKSKGNIVDPVVLADRYTADAIRYFLLRDMPLESDTQFSTKLLIQRINSDLANDLGNLLSRTVAMIQKYFDGVLPAHCAETSDDKELKELAEATHKAATEAMDAYKPNEALAAIFKLVGASNKYIDITMPWILAKDEAQKERLGTVLYNLAECLRIVSVLITPFMPKTGPKMQAQLGIEDQKDILTYDSVSKFGKLAPGTKVVKGAALFPRLDVDKELEALDSMTKKEKAEEKTEAPKEANEPAKEQITIDDFAKLDLRVGTVIAAEEVKRSKKLLKLTVKIGDETRTILSGIKKWYNSEDMVGKNVVIVYNLKPAKLCGEMSEGMLLAASDSKDELLSLVTLDKTDIENGWKVR